MPLLATKAAASAQGFGLNARNVRTAFIVATGGTIVTTGDYKVHTFNSSANFSVASCPVGATVQAIVVAGGGSAVYGGGGAGGYIYDAALVVDLGDYAAVVGAASVVSQGNNSTFGGLTALGGGYGNSFVYPDPGVAGGSGGGGLLSVGGAGLQPTSLSGGFGNAGGTGTGAATAGGGGGAGGAGATSLKGAGRTADFGAATTLAEGGSPGDGAFAAATANTGNGGNGWSGSGASGTIRIRYQFQ